MQFYSRVLRRGETRVGLTFGTQPFRQGKKSIFIEFALIKVLFRIEVCPKYDPNLYKTKRIKK